MSVPLFGSGIDMIFIQGIQLEIWKPSLDSTSTVELGRVKKLKIGMFVPSDFFVKVTKISRVYWWLFLANLEKKNLIPAKAPMEERSSILLYAQIKCEFPKDSLFENLHSVSLTTAVPLNKIKKNPNLAILLTDYGGHIGFMEGPTIRGRSFVERLFSQYVSQMLTNSNN